ncbi:mucin-4-like isoform X3 [Gigaspora margarita]|uniref:Mucin-4-like isoform X3 n=1 Tax=Gigaspora margarita TaxID=4874 RepID=A0A8H4AIM8_GIGMA|nr:mucin-4-like isoform X3 [Gigaspora margarita]
MFFSKKSPINSTTLTKKIFIIITFFCFIEKAFAHGFMADPKIRMFSFDNDILQMTAGPTTIQPCSGFEAGPIVATYQSGQLIPITWTIFTAHQGSCSVQLSTNGNDTDFQELKSYPNCADEIGTFNDNVQLPAGVACDKCTFRWVWNSALNGELYLQCSDIKIEGVSNKSTTTVSPMTTIPISTTISSTLKTTMTSTSTIFPTYTSLIATPTKSHKPCTSSTSLIATPTKCHKPCTSSKSSIAIPTKSHKPCTSSTRSSNNHRPYTTAHHSKKKNHKPCTSSKSLIATTTKSHKPCTSSKSSIATPTKSHKPCTSSKTSIATPTKSHKPCATSTRSSNNHKPYITVHRSKKYCSKKYKRHDQSSKCSKKYKKNEYY